MLVQIAVIAALTPTGSVRDVPPVPSPGMALLWWASPRHFNEKHERYAERAASDLMKRGVHPNFFHFRIKPAFRFLKHFVWQLGFLDGAAGYKLSKLFAKSVRLRYEKLRELLEES